MNRDVDHMHMLMSTPPKYSVSDVVKHINANTGRRMCKKFPHLDKVYWGMSRIWSVGYFVSTVGVHESTIRKYIEQQGQEDNGQEKLGL